MADINIGSDQLLIQVLNNSDRVVVTQEATGQQVAAVTVDNFRKLICGMDHSKLAERAVPGEFWPGPNGEPKQVYQMTFTGLLSTAAIETTLKSGIHRAAYQFGEVMIYPPGWTPKPFPNEYYWGYRVVNSGLCICIYDMGTTGLSGKAFSLNFKYTKL